MEIVKYDIIITSGIFHGKQTNMIGKSESPAAVEYNLFFTTTPRALVIAQSAQYIQQRKLVRAWLVALPTASTLYYCNGTNIIRASALPVVCKSIVYRRCLNSWHD